MKRLIFSLLSCLLLSTQSIAQTDEEEFAPVPAPPDIPDAVESGQPLEPVVTIIRKDESIFEEYRANGRLYMIKVTPKIGKSYYLIDIDGDGQMESRRSELYEDFNVPQWVLFSW